MMEKEERAQLTVERIQNDKKGKKKQQHQRSTADKRNNRVPQVFEFSIRNEVQQEHFSLLENVYFKMTNVYFRTMLFVTAQLCSHGKNKASKGDL